MFNSCLVVRANFKRAEQESNIYFSKIYVQPPLGAQGGDYMALNHEVHIPEVMSIIFLLAFYSQPTIKDT